jgi:plastocyanin
MTKHLEQTSDVSATGHQWPRSTRPRARVRRNLGMMAVALLGVALVAGACSSGASSSSSSTTTTASGGSGSGGASSPTGGSATITIQNFSFSPAKITVTPGEKVTVTNKDSVAHTVTANDKKFNTGDIDPGKTVTFTAPSSPGSYPYICTIHQYMTGMLTVKG